MKQFIVDEYQDGVVTVFAQTATFKVTHSTEVEPEESFIDCWSHDNECHYTKTTGVNYYATTDIKSIELMLDDDVAVRVALFGETLAEIKQAIEEAAARDFIENESMAA